MGHYSLDHLHIRYCDFAYKPNGPFRMANANIGDATARTFAEYVCLSNWSFALAAALADF